MAQQAFASCGPNNLFSAFNSRCLYPSSSPVPRRGFPQKTSWIYHFNRFHVLVFGKSPWSSYGTKVQSHFPQCYFHVIFSALMIVVMRAQDDNQRCVLSTSLGNNLGFLSAFPGSFWEVGPSGQCCWPSVGLRPWSPCSYYHSSLSHHLTCSCTEETKKDV